MTSAPLAVFFLDCLTFVEEGAALSRNGWKHPPNDIASRVRRSESSVLSNTIVISGVHLPYIKGN